MKDYYQVSIRVSDEAVQEMLVAQLAQSGYEGFVQEDDYLKAFIAEDEFKEGDLELILPPLNLNHERELVRHINWNQQWEEGFSPVLVGDFCAVRAGFHAPVGGTAFELIVTPKMSFGTGHHATTYLMIEAMSRIDFAGKEVLDFGTGTGVLAILAEKMGARVIEAIDYDPLCIDNAGENIVQNNCTAVRVYQADSLAETGTFDVILANINKNVLLATIPGIRHHVKPGGLILLSGLLTEDFDDISAAVAQTGGRIVSNEEKNGWICLRVEV